MSGTPPATASFTIDHFGKKAKTFVYLSLITYVVESILSPEADKSEPKSSGNG